MKSIPVLHIKGKSIAEVWEKSLLEVYDKGIKIKTQYDKESDPASRDSIMIMEISDPLFEPMIHRNMPMGLEDLQEYTMEVCDGIKNHWVRNKNDPSDTRWQYTYNQRLFNYDVGEELFNQIEIMCEKISKTPYTRRAQAVTWKVWEDNSCEDPACLQSIWGRCIEDDGKLVLNTNVRFRSNDAYKAAQLNIFAIINLVKRMAGRISEISGREVVVGQYVHFADSYHIYGSYLKEFENIFLKGVKEKSFEERTFNYCDVKDIMDESIPSILQKVKDFDREKSRK